MEKYLLDSNIYINFYERYYQAKYFPTFWSKLPNILNEYVVIPRIVVDENYQDAEFRKWIDKNITKDLLDHKKYAKQWSEVLQYVENCKYYKSAALIDDRGWAHEKIADPWLIAIAKERELTIVTSEVRNPNLHNPNGNRAAKIPDVCDELGVKCIDMNGFFEEINLRV